jgi:hypothetical protein
MKKDDKARVRVFFGEIEGDNESIRDGLRSIAQAVNRTFQSGTRVVKVITSGNNLNEKDITANLEQQLIDADLGDEEDIGDGDDSDSEKQRKGTRPKKPPTYSFVKDLDLRPQGKTSLRVFYENKKPSGPQQILTLVVYYLQHELEVKNISANHVYTALKELTELGVRVPNIPSGVRNISNRKGWLDTSDLNNLRMTVPGDNFIEHDLPRNAGASPAE